MLPAQPNQSLMDGLTCLQALAGYGVPIGVRELARQHGLEPTRVQRLLKTLAHLGLAEQTADRKYRPGPGIHVLAAQSLFGSGLLRRAIGPLESLAGFGLIVALGVRWRDQVAYLYHAPPGTRSVDAVGRTGLFPATRSAIGLVLLSQLTNCQVEEIYRREAVPGFPGGTPSLLETLAEVRKKQYARVPITSDGSVESLGVGLEAAAAAAMAFSGDLRPHETDKLVAALHQAAKAINCSSCSS